MAANHPDYSEIVPKSAMEARGIDFCGTYYYYYIIRSDLGVYMRSTNFNEGKEIKIYPLSPACQWGDHYLATGSDNFYIIKGDEYRRVTNMTEDKDAVVCQLHPNCRGGSHYYFAFGNYYIMFANKGVYRQVKNLNTDEGAVEDSIHEAFKDGLYFWGTTGYFNSGYVYCLKQSDEWGVTYHRNTDVNLDKNPVTFSIHESVLNFLPGGIAQTTGKAFGYWHNIDYFANKTDSTVDWEKIIRKPVGFNRSEMSSIEHNWSIEIGAQYQSGLLSETISKYQFSLKAKYGGKSVNTEQQQWSNMTEESETLNCLHIKPHSEMYIWQYQMGFGKKKNLFSRDLKITEDSNPPEEPALYFSHAN